MTVYLPSAQLINAMRHLNQAELLSLDDDQLRPILACLSRYFLLSERSVIAENNSLAEDILLRMHGFPEVNGILSMFEKIDFDGILASLRAYGQEWIFTKFSESDGKNSVQEFENCGSDLYRRLFIVLFGYLNLKSHFDVSSSTDFSSTWELLNCPAHWIAILHILSVALIELAECFSVVDVAEAALLLDCQPIRPGGCSFGAAVAWWVIATHPYALNTVMCRVFKWKLPVARDNPSLHRLHVNRFSFLLAHDEIFHQTPSLLQTSLGFHTLSSVVLTLASQYLSSVVELETSISSNSADLKRALSIIWSVSSSNSVCFSSGRIQTLAARLHWIVKKEHAKHSEVLLLKTIRANLLTLLSRCSEEWNTTKTPPNPVILSNIIRNLAAFQLQLGLPKLAEQEIEIVASLYRDDYPDTPGYSETICDLICLGCACHELTVNERYSECVSSWLTLWRTSREENVNNLSDVGELILQIGLQCYASSSPGLAPSHTHCQSSLSMLISAKLKLPAVTISSNQLLHLRKVFLSTILPESTLASSVLLIPSTAVDGLSMSGYTVSNGQTIESTSMLASACVLILLRSPIFVKHQQHLQLKDWLLAQLKSGALTTDPSFDLLLQNQSTQAGLSTWGGSSLPTQQVNPLAALIDADSFSESVEESCSTLFGNETLPSKEVQAQHINKLLGILFYALNSIDFIVSSGGANDMACQKHARNQLTKYLDLTDKIPVKVILFHIEQASPKTTYSRIYPVLMRLLYTYFPHMCLVGDCLQLFIAARDGVSLLESQIKRLKSSTKSINDAGVQFYSSDRKMVDSLEAIAAENFPTRLRHADYLISILPEFLDTVSSTSNATPSAAVKLFTHRQLSYATARVFGTTFAKTAVAFSTKQIGLTAHKLVGPGAPTPSASSLLAGDKSQQFIIEPLSFLTNMDKRVFRNPVILRVALWVYSCLLAINRQFFAHRIMAETATNFNHHSGQLPPGVLVPFENADSEAAVAMDLLQQCESITFLLGHCASESTNVPMLVETRSIICSFIHQLFLHNHQLVKIVHFQTYPVQAVPIAVSLIPSIHVCLDFLPELLTTSSPTRQVFSVVLLSHIATLYPVPRAFSLSKLAVDVVDTMVTTMTADKRLAYFGCKSPVIDAIKRIAGCFPPLIEDIVNLFLRIHAMTKVHKASSLALASPWPHGVAKYNYRELEKLRVDLKKAVTDVVRKTKVCKALVV